MDETPRDVERELRARVSTSTEEPEREPSPPGRPPLRRRASGRLLAGVAGGLADHWDVPALVVRIPLAIALVIAGGLVNDVLFGSSTTLDPSDGPFGVVVLVSFAAVIAYVVLWIVLPSADLPRSPVGRVVDRGRGGASAVMRRYPGIRSFPGLVLLGIGAAILADRLGIWEPDVVVAFALIALGIWLYRRDATERERVASDVGAAAPGVPADRSAGLSAQVETWARPPRERSPLGWITFGAALLVVCVAGIWSFADDGIIERLGTIPALGLLVLAAGLLVGSVFGKTRWLILPALLLTPVVLLASLVRVPVEGRIGDFYFRPHDLGEFGVAGYSNSVGSIYVDLARFVDRPDVRRELWLSTGAGTVTVVVPYDAHVRADASTGLGTIGLGPQHVQGIEVSDAADLDPKHGDGARFTFHVDVGLGDVYVLRYAATPKQLRELERLEGPAERQAGREAGGQ